MTRSRFAFSHHRPPSFARERGSRRTQWKVAFAILAAAALSACAPVHARPGELTPVAARVTNATAAADVATLHGWGDRLAVASARSSVARDSASVLVAAEADAWLAYARESYRVDRRGAAVDLAFAEARRRVEALERGPEPTRAIAAERRPVADTVLASAAACRVNGPVARLRTLAVLMEAFDPPVPAIADTAVAAVSASGMGAPGMPTLDTLRADAGDSLPAPAAQPASAPPPASYVRTVHFALNSDRLSATNRAVLDSVVRIAGVAPAVRLEIHGHTDPLGSARYNQELARRRAERVAAYLRSRGVTQPLVVRAFGSSQPATDERTRAGNARNRRVEITVTTADRTRGPSGADAGGPPIERNGPGSP